MLIALSLLGCAPDLILNLPDSPLSGEVELSVQGNYDSLVLEVDSIVLDGGPGPVFAYTWDSTSVDDGTHQIRGLGFLGNREPVEVVEEVEVDQAAGDDEAPVVNFTRPGEGQVVGGDSVNIQLSITENVGLEEVVVYADGGVLANLPAEGPWELAWENVVTGEHCLDAEATDIAGNVGTAGVCFEVSSESDEVECGITSPQDGGTVGGSVTIQAYGGAPGGIDRIDFYADGEEIGALEDAPWSMSWDSSGDIGAEVELSILATSAEGGLCTDAITVSVIEDGGSGDFEVILTQPTDGANIGAGSTGVPIKAAVGGGQGAASATLYIDDVEIGSLASAPWEWTWDATPYEGSEVVIEVVGTEANTGNTASDSATVTVSGE
jgi:hypothetical protein